MVGNRPLTNVPSQRCVTVTAKFEDGQLGLSSSLADVREKDIVVLDLGSVDDYLRAPASMVSDTL